LTERGAFLALKMYGKDLPNDSGYPILLVIPGEPGAEWVKWVGTIEVAQVPADQVPPAGKDMPQSISFNPVNSGFLVPAKDGTQVSGPVHLEGWAYAWDRPITKVRFSGDYGKTWQAYALPQPADPYRWVYWKFDWTPPVPGTYLLKVKGEAGDKVQVNEDNLVLVVK
jgi:DMSO/TMAO reductase YedYZ molybdopterin-dependent catalytic subunit